MTTQDRTTGQHEDEQGRARADAEARARRDRIAAAAHRLVERGAPRSASSPVAEDPDRFAAGSRVLSLRQAAELLGAAHEDLLRDVAAGRYPSAVRLGPTWIVDRSDLEPPRA